MKIKEIAVVGIGTMGSQIGIVRARGGFETSMVDVSADLVGKGLNGIRPFLNSQVKKGKMAEKETENILFHFPLGPLAAADAFGLDILLACMRTFHQELGEKYQSAPPLSP